ncbi:MAG: hypothetical protein RIE53_01330 [Rhodothermales bacterium]
MAGFVVPPVAVILFIVVFPALETRSGLDGTEASLQAQATHLSWLQARLEAAGLSEPSLSIDLADTTNASAGTVVLFMGGVPVRTMRAERAHIDDIARIPRPKPADALRLTSFHSDIPHVPVREVVAPVDTVEAAKRPPQDVPEPDVPDYAVLQYDGLEVRLVSGRLPGPGFLLDTLPTRMGRGGVTTVLRLQLPAEDIRAIYRALQEGSILALRLPGDVPAADRIQVESSR